MTTSPPRTRKPAAGAPHRAAAKKTIAPKPYHHGALPKALLAAAETVLVREGLAGLGLRAIAREAGVSHTAPKHHFGDGTGLLSELAAVGFGRLRDAMLAAMAPLDPSDAQGRRNAIAQVYVHFAHRNPALFGLMFRNEMIDWRRPALAEAAGAAIRVMALTISGQAELPDAAPLALSGPDAVRITAAWAHVHGLASLLIDQRLQGILKATPAFDDPLALVDAVLRGTQPGLDPATSEATAVHRKK
ncbi:MAG TPA: WHG domain-containing protein [Rhodoferax sp.]|nr:WHG domain-containing protein [Rhodoferax sp.]